MDSNVQFLDALVTSAVSFIRSVAPSLIRVLGTVDPPDGASAIESLIYQCETIKIDGLKLYPPGPDARGWVLERRSWMAGFDNAGDG